MDYIDRICLLTEHRQQRKTSLWLDLGLAELIGRITPYLATDKRLLVASICVPALIVCDGALSEI